VSAAVIVPGGQVTKDPSDERIFQFDWDTDAGVPVGATISSSVFTITTIRPTGDTALTKDNESVLAGLRKTQLRIKAGTVGGLYEVANKVVTNETPAQTFEISFRVLVQDR
jgi:hypothetical protein